MLNKMIEKYKETIEIDNVITSEFKGVSSFYLLPSGEFLNCSEVNGYRRNDHSIIFKAIDNIKYYDFETIHKTYKLVRLVPESEIALVYVGQSLTKKQKDAIKKIGFKIEKYKY